MCTYYWLQVVFWHQDKNCPISSNIIGFVGGLKNEYEEKTFMFLNCSMVMETVRSQVCPDVEEDSHEFRIRNFCSMPKIQEFLPR